MTDEGRSGGFAEELFEEAAKKSALVWISAADGTTRAVWHVWHEGAVLLVGDGPGEQPLFGLDDGGEVEVTVRSKESGGRLAVRALRVVLLKPRGEAWREAVEVLRGKRLNAPDYAELTERWARECTVLRLHAGAEAEVGTVVGVAPARYADGVGDGSLAARPVRTSATTRGEAPVGLPRMVARAVRGRGRKGNGSAG